MGFRKSLERRRGWWTYLSKGRRVKLTSYSPAYKSDMCQRFLGKTADTLLLKCDLYAGLVERKGELF